MERRILIFSIVILLSLAAFLSGYFLSQPAGNSKSNLQSAYILDKFQTKNPDQPSSAGLKNPINSAPILSAFSGPNDSVLYIDKTSGKTLSYDLISQRESTLSDKPQSNIASIDWSPGKNGLILNRYINNQNKYQHINLSNGQVTDLPSMQSEAFSPDGSKIAYFSQTPNGGYISISSPNGEAPRQLLQTRLENLKIGWLNSGLILVKTLESSGAYSFFTISGNGELRKILSSNYGFDYKVSPRGDGFIYSTGDINNTDLLYHDALSEEDYDLKLAIQAKKCAWSIDGQNIICAIAASSDQSKEDLYSIQIKDPEDKKLIMSLPKQVSVKDMFYSDTEKYIFIVNQFNDMIYAYKVAEN